MVGTHEVLLARCATTISVSCRSRNARSALSSATGSRWQVPSSRMAMLAGDRVDPHQDGEPR
jgi:hypothetical protein